MDLSTNRSRWLALFVLCLGELMILLDATIVNVAMPSIGQDLGFTRSNLSWVVNAYLIAFGGLLLLAGRLGDLIGKRQVFLAGVVVFTVASVFCAASRSQLMLIAGRFAQGVGGALASAVILSMVVAIFPAPRDRAKAIGAFGFVTSTGGSVGLVAGGALTAALSWHWIFLINLPVGLVTVVLCLRRLPRDTGIGLRQGADVPGAAMLIAGLMLAVYTILEVGTWGWGAPRTIGLGAVAIALVAGFVVRQLRTATPLVPMRIFRSRHISGANTVQLLMVAGMFGVFFFGALYLQQVLGFDPLHVGLAFLPAAFTMGGTALWLSGPVAQRFGPRTTLVISLTLLALCMLMWARTPDHGHYAVDVVPAMVLFGLGGGIGFPALMSVAMTGVAPTESGVASGLLSTTYQVGGAVGLAVLSTIAAGGVTLNTGFHVAHAVGAALVVVAIVVTLVVLRQPKPAAAGVVEIDAGLAPIVD